MIFLLFSALIAIIVGLLAKVLYAWWNDDGVGVGPANVVGADSEDEEAINSGSCFLTSEQKDTLINAVEERPLLWDYKADSFSDVERKRNEYAEIAKIMPDGSVQHTGQHIQTEWKKLRDEFNRTLKKVLKGLKPEQVGWRYWERMQFIAETVKAHLRQPFGRGRRILARAFENGEASTSGDCAYQDLVAKYAGSENGTLESGDGPDAEMDADAEMKLFSLQQLVAYADFDGDHEAHDIVDDDAPSGSHVQEHAYVLRFTS